MAGANTPGDGLWGWLGRQIGHVKAAVHHDPVKNPGGAGPAGLRSNPPAAAAPAAKKSASPPPASPKVVYRNDKVEELAHPTQPHLKLRRTVIDEVIVQDPARTPPDAADVEAEAAADRREKDQA